MGASEAAAQAAAQAAALAGRKRVEELEEEHASALEGQARAHGLALERMEAEGAERAAVAVREVARRALEEKQVGQRAKMWSNKRRGVQGQRKQRTRSCGSVDCFWRG